MTIDVLDIPLMRKVTQLRVETNTEDFKCQNFLPPRLQDFCELLRKIFSYRGFFEIFPRGHHMAHGSELNCLQKHEYFSFIMRQEVKTKSFV